MRYVMFATAIIAAGLSSSSAGATLFRGQDNQPGTGPLGSFPNSSAAEASFLSSVSGTASSFGFESFAIGAVPASWDFGAGLTAVYTNEATEANSISGLSTPVDTFATDGVRHLYTETRPGAGFFRLNFNRDLTAFGMYVTDASDWFGIPDVPGPLFIELLDAQGAVLERHDLTTSIAPGQLRSGNAAYFGVIADAPFRGVRLAQPVRASGSISQTDAVGIDGITVVPTPASGALAVGLAILGPRRRR